MFDAFPYDEWNEQITTFWTFGVEGDTGTIILTILGVLAMIWALVQFVRLESQKLDAQAAALRRGMSPSDAGSSSTTTPGRR
jgi:hypothetical protein